MKTTTIESMGDTLSESKRFASDCTEAELQRAAVLLPDARAEYTDEAFAALVAKLAKEPVAVRALVVCVALHSPLSCRLLSSGDGLTLLASVQPWLVKHGIKNGSSPKRDDFKDNAERVVAALRLAGCGEPVPLAVAASLLPTLREWEGVARSMKRRMRIKKGGGR